MKLNYKKVFYVGLAFFLITIFWQTYDSIIAKILIDKFGLNHFWSGVVMALDNILALILLPLFGAISDRTNHKKGRRTPFVIVGTIVAAFAFMALTFVDNAQTTKINQTQIVEKYEASSGVYDVRKEVLFWNDLLTDMKAERDSALANNNIDQARYDKWHNDIYLKMQDQLANSDAEGKINAREVAYLDGYYTTYLSNLAWEVTIQDPANLIIFIGILFVALIAMSLFRSPAVSLMPDVTIKPLRSKANAIINLMGAGAGVTSLILLTIFGLDGKSYVNYMWAFISVGTIMLIVLVVFLLKVNEPKLVQEKIKEDELYGITEEDEEDGEAEKMNELPKDKKLSLYLILLSVFLWFMGYNAIMTKVSDYAPKILQLPSFTIPLLIANVTAILAFIPIGIVSTKIGRKKAILLGIILLTLCFGTIFFVNQDTPVVILYAIFGLTGIGWATINVNSYPMVVELSKGSNVGKYTGYYYSFSMAAQILTPIFSGFLMDQIHQKVLFPYATIFVALAFFTMFFVKHGDAQVIKRSVLESFDVDMD